MKKREAGFSLVELAVVLAIVGLALGMGISLVSSQRVQQTANTTNTRLDVIKAALQAFIAKNYRLPCPAVPTLVPTDPNYGVEAATPGTCTNAIQITASPLTTVRGIIPWQSLGIGRDMATDAWGNFVTYQVVLLETSRTFDTVSQMRGQLSIHSNAPPVMGLPASGNQLNGCSTLATDNTCNRLAVVILVSHGANALGAYTNTGQRMPLPDATADPREYANVDDDNMFVQPAPGIDTVYDDVVIALSPDDLLFPLAQSGQIQSAIAVTNQRIDVLRTALISYVAAHPAQLPTTLNLLGVPAAVLTDGWGSLFQYCPDATISLGGLTKTSPATGTGFYVRSLGVNKVSELPGTCTSCNVCTTMGGDDIAAFVSVNELRGRMIAAGVSLP